MGKFKLWIRQNSPTLLMVSGIINSAAAIGFAIGATKRLPDALAPYNRKIILVDKKINKLLPVDKNEVIPEENAEKIKAYKGELRKLYFKKYGKATLMYAPVAVSFGLSVASMVGSHNIMKGRNIALASALSTMKSGWDAYRARVKDKIGDEAEELLYNNETVEKVKVKDEKTGKMVEKEVIKKNDDDGSGLQVYEVFFGPGDNGYEKDFPEGNLNHLMLCERHFNLVLQTRGYVFLDEIFNALDIQPSHIGKRRLQAAHVLGWLYKPEDKSRNSYIDFGLHDQNGKLTSHAKAFSLGLEDFIKLTFNVDGDITTGDNGEPFMDVAIKKG